MNDTSARNLIDQAKHQSRHPIAQEVLAFLANLMVCLLGFGTVWYVSVTRRSDLPGEATEALFILMVLYVPIMFALAYIIATLLLARWWPYKWRAGDGNQIRFWAIGLVLGPLLAFLASHTKVFWILNPILRLLGL